MGLTRRQLLGSAGAAALGAAGVYEVVDRLTQSPSRPPALALPPEQHVLEGVRTVPVGPPLADGPLPIGRRASKTQGKPVSALLDAMRFPSDPPQTILERNDVAVLLRSDSLDHIADGANSIFKDLDVFRPTSIRK